jgi:hypothetical protein
VVPIQCDSSELDVIQEQLPCRMEHFPIKYLGLPLSIKKLSRAQLQPIIDKLADLLPGWRADLMTRAGRAVHVQFVITTTIIYQDMALDLPAWFIKTVDKIRRGYFWRGSRDAKGGHFLISWPKVTRPKELGGLGISDLQSLNWALRVRWLWLKKTDPDKPWASFQMHSGWISQRLFDMAVATEIGDGTTSLFWLDRWVHGQRIEDLAPRLFQLVPKRVDNRRMAVEALTDSKWV